MGFACARMVVEQRILQQKRYLTYTKPIVQEQSL